jgi:hypothetical protein
MNRKIYGQPASRLNSLIRKSALTIISAGAVFAMSGTYAHAMGRPPDWGPLPISPKPLTPSHSNPPAAPEVATWYIGAGVLAMLSVELLRRKSLAGKQSGSN